jgi:chemotaxis protein histidine kinase CheA
VELESHVGRGTTFRIWLPLAETENCEQLIARKKSQNSDEK